MISDFIKGRKKFDYPPVVQQGIALHRAIDAFTDDHPVTKEARLFFKPAVGLYSGAFVDVSYDHFLANDPYQFKGDGLSLFTEDTYRTLLAYKGILPDDFRGMLPYMTTQNWLYNYSNRRGIESSFGGVVRRARYMTDSSEVFSLFSQHYEALQKCYNEFFPSLKEFTVQQLKDLGIA